jgi:hypothetical protein
LSRDEVSKYFEVRLFSLVLMAISFFVVCVFLLFFFISREQYAYSVVVIVLMVIVLLGALELSRYAKILKRREKAAVQKNQIAPILLLLLRFDYERIRVRSSKPPQERWQSNSGMARERLASPFLRSSGFSDCSQPLFAVREGRMISPSFSNFFSLVHFNLCSLFVRECMLKEG